MAVSRLSSSDFDFMQRSLIAVNIRSQLFETSHLFQREVVQIYIAGWCVSFLGDCHSYCLLDLRPRPKDSLYSFNMMFSRFCRSASDVGRTAVPSARRKLLMFR